MFCEIICKSQNFAADTGLVIVTFPENKVKMRATNSMMIMMMIYDRDNQG